MATADLDRDGDLDLAVGNGNSTDVTVLLGDGTGNFGSPTVLTAGADSRGVAIGDVNNDGRADLVVADNDDNTVSIFLNTTPFPSVDLSVDTNAGTEVDTTVITVTATANQAVLGNQTVDVGVTGTGITTDDFNLSNTTLTINNGSTTGSVTFTVVDDTDI
ncbi:MAG: VCBS repeat-containing protein, partial [Cyanobacteria bacterium P01_F01_bin.153]